MTATKTILIVEDDGGIRLILRDALTAQGYQVITAADGPEGLAKALEARPDLLILDVMLPGLDGFEVCKKVRQEGVTSPIMMLTVRDEELDKVLGLEVGADDYVTKPFSLKEVSARVKALFRRVEDYQAGLDVYRFGKIELDFKKFESRKDGRPLGLTPLELRILKVLVTRKGQVVTRDEFLDLVWGVDNLAVSHRTVDSHVAHIRKKVEDDPSRPEHILSVHSIGYKFED
ncbi:MAG TPA: response regulator transcription factor [Candidatus Aminicenantes bacterium]|nr:response regulator transcription factor [Candidatus Aminicenantes bacterium]